MAEGTRLLFVGDIDSDMTMDLHHTQRFQTLCGTTRYQLIRTRVGPSDRIDIPVIHVDVIGELNVADRRAGRAI